MNGGFEKKRICVVGCGYIGLPTAAMFASCGCDVLAVDVSKKVVSRLNEGGILIEEPGLSEMVGEAVTAGNLHASLVPAESDAFIIAVPTPFTDDGTRACDLSYVKAAVSSVLPFVQKDNVIIVESTIAPRSMDDHVKPMVEACGFTVGKDVFLAHCPERVLPGQILHELVYNNRIVGGITEACTEAAAEVYSIFVKGEIIKTQARTAEMAKCMENTYRDVNIALANELACICDKLEIDCLDVIEMANKHPRVNLHYPGPGVGGHCLAIDPYFICAEAPEQAKIIKLARDTNSAMPDFVCEKVLQILRKSGTYPSTAKIAALGITYKGNVDDCRESPALKIIETLKRKGIDVAICDPHANPEEGKTLEEAFENANLAVVLVDHDEFKGDSLKPYLASMDNAIIFDTRNIVNDIEGVVVLNYGNVFTV